MIILIFKYYANLNITNLQLFRSSILYHWERIKNFISSQISSSFSKSNVSPTTSYLDHVTSIIESYFPTLYPRAQSCLPWNTFQPERSISWFHILATQIVALGGWNLILTALPPLAPLSCGLMFLTIPFWPSSLTSLLSDVPRPSSTLFSSSHRTSEPSIARFELYLHPYVDYFYTIKSTNPSSLITHLLTIVSLPQHTQISLSSPSRVCQAFCPFSYLPYLTSSVFWYQFDRNLHKSIPNTPISTHNQEIVYEISRRKREQCRQQEVSTPPKVDTSQSTKGCPKFCYSNYPSLLFFIQLIWGIYFGFAIQKQSQYKERHTYIWVCKYITQFLIFILQHGLWKLFFQIDIEQALTVARKKNKLPVYLYQLVLANQYEFERHVKYTIVEPK